jgi:Mn2+/Fe2+ NRAMP family transporter
MAYQFGEIVHDADFVDWWEDQEERARLAFVYWILDRVNTILQMILQLGYGEKEIHLASKSDWSAIKLPPYLQIEDTITQVLGIIATIVQGATVVPEVSFFTTSLSTDGRQKDQTTF